MVVVASCWDPLINKLPIKEGFLALLPDTSCWVCCDELVSNPEETVWLCIYFYHAGVVVFDEQ